MTEGLVDVTGGRVWYRLVGEGGVPLLCLHGGPGMPHDYLLPLERLSSERVVVFYDQLGCGQSERPEDKSLWRLDRFVDEVEQVRRELALETFHLLGHSWGGALALSYASIRPRGLASLVLASPLVEVSRWLEDAGRLRSRLPQKTQDVLERHEREGFTECPEYQAATFEFYKRHFCRLDPWPEALEKTFARLGLDVYLTMWGPTEFYAAGNLKDFDATGRLGQIHVPVLLTCGRYDESTPEAVAHFDARIKDSEMKVFEESSHTPHLEEADEYVEVVRRFLARVEASRT